jgi:hypothetical protein
VSRVVKSKRLAALLQGSLVFLPPDPSKRRKRSEKLREHLRALDSKPTPLKASAGLV